MIIAISKSEVNWYGSSRQDSATHSTSPTQVFIESLGMQLLDMVLSDHTIPEQNGVDPVFEQRKSRFDHEGR